MLSTAVRLIYSDSVGSVGPAVEASVAQGKRACTHPFGIAVPPLYYIHDVTARCTAVWLMPL